MADTSSTAFIFYLILEENLPKHYYMLDRHFKEIGYILVPVKIDQLQLLVAASEQDQVIVLCSVSNSREYRIYNEKVRGFLKYVLKSKRLTFMHLSSFSKVSDQRLFSLQKNYYFMKLPIKAEELCFRIGRYYELKKQQLTKWPGGKRAGLSSNGSV